MVVDSKDWGIQWFTFCAYLVTAAGIGGTALLYYSTVYTLQYVKIAHLKEREWIRKRESLENIVWRRKDGRGG